MFFITSVGFTSASLNTKTNTALITNKNVLTTNKEYQNFLKDVTNEKAKIFSIVSLLDTTLKSIDKDYNASKLIELQKKGIELQNTCEVIIEKLSSTTVITNYKKEFDILKSKNKTFAKDVVNEVGQYKKYLIKKQTVSDTLNSSSNTQTGNLGNNTDKEVNKVNKNKKNLTKKLPDSNIQQNSLSNIQTNNGGNMTITNTTNTTNTTNIYSYAIEGEQIIPLINGVSSSSKISNILPYLYGGKVFLDINKRPITQMNIAVGYYGIVGGGTYYGYIRKYPEGTNFLRDFVAGKGTEIIGITKMNILDVNGLKTASSVLYYNPNENSLFVSDADKQSSNKNIIKKEIPGNYMFNNIGVLPGKSCASKKIDCPKINTFNYFGGFGSDGKLKETNGISFPYKKYNFSLSPTNELYAVSKDKVNSDVTYFMNCNIHKEAAQKNCENEKKRRQSVGLTEEVEAEFSQKSSRSKRNTAIAYIAYANNAGTLSKVKVSNKYEVWSDINNSKEPIYIQMLDNNNLIIVYKDTSSNYTLEKYTFESNIWKKVNGFEKKITSSPLTTDYFYDDSSDILYVSQIKLENNGKYIGEVVSFQFNGKNIGYKQTIYTKQLTTKKFANYYKNFQTWDGRIQTISSNGNNDSPVDTVISSLIIDRENNMIYVMGFAHNGSNALQFISRVGYEMTNMVSSSTTNY